ncbi:hypothetical protein AMECASPLE_019614 [Ameca splendens]|uniref:Uncharacterized protein n=1 Tax=Ameca splendens TaxID=208324 RepID=A0ABV0YQD8_9TELE
MTVFFFYLQSGFYWFPSSTFNERNQPCSINSSWVPWLAPDLRLGTLPVSCRVIIMLHHGNRQANEGEGSCLQGGVPFPWLLDKPPSAGIKLAPRRSPQPAERDAQRSEEGAPGANCRCPGLKINKGCGFILTALQWQGRTEV